MTRGEKDAGQIGARVRVVFPTGLVGAGVVTSSGRNDPLVTVALDDGTSATVHYRVVELVAVTP